ncbi:MAG: hypothetical protein R3D98_06010 [Candidatus Krumholzibacteriia bacterium]
MRLDGLGPPAPTLAGEVPAAVQADRDGQADEIAFELDIVADISQRCDHGVLHHVLDLRIVGSEELPDVGPDGLGQGCKRRVGQRHAARGAGSVWRLQ